MEFLSCRGYTTIPFTFITDSDISNTISTQVEKNILKNDSLHYYPKNYGGTDVTSNAEWNLTTSSSGTCTGYFKNDVHAFENRFRLQVVI